MRRNEGGQAEYTCPHCLIEEVEKGERKPLPQSAVLGAKDLPRTLLSDHIEQRLMRKLKQERHERARALGKSFDEVSLVKFSSFIEPMYDVIGVTRPLVCLNLCSLDTPAFLFD